MARNHTWKFFRAGGVDQVVIESGADLANLDQLDLKLWIALAMPVKGMDLDAKTAAFLDADGDGRIRAHDILETVKWLREKLVDLDGLLPGKAEASLAKIADAELKKTAERIAKEAGASDGIVTLENVTDAEKRFAEKRFNGDGVITEATPEEDSLAKAVGEILAAYGNVPDRNGKPGVDKAKIAAFFDDAKALHAWYEEGEKIEKPLGDGTAAAADKLRALAPKLDDYFTRSRLAGFDERAYAVAHGTEADLTALVGKDLSNKAPELARLPLSKPTPSQPLPLEGATNPAFASELVAFRDAVVRPLLGAGVNALSEADYAKIVARFDAFTAWRGKKPETKLGGLSEARVKELVAGDARATLEGFVADDEALRSEYDRIAAVEKLLRLSRDFVRVVRNFVSFVEFYSKKPAIFQAGTLYLDGRGCSLTIEVTDPAKHSTLAGLASTYLAYCDCTRAGQAKKQIVAAFTAGDSDNLMVGRNGVFYDREGKDWDATITKLVENPISIRQAFWAPYKKFIRLVEEQVARRASAADAEAQAKIQSAAESTANADREAAAPRPAAPPAPRFDVGTIAALGVAIGGIGAMITGLVSAFFGLGIWMPFGLLALVLMISGPSMLLAYLKLRRRNLGPLLDASGWAINGLTQVNVPFGGALTDVAVLPPNAQRLLHDPYAEEKKPWKLYATLAIVVFLVLAWTMGSLDRFLPRGMKAGRVLHPRPAPTAPAEP